MNASPASQPDVPDLYITAELDRRPPTRPDYRREMLAIQDLAARMSDSPDEVLPRFVDLAMEIAAGVSAGISLYEPAPAPGVFRWCFLRGLLARFDGATTPRDFSPCGVTLDENGPILSLHPERYYSWISDAGIVVPEVLLVPLYRRDAQPVGTLWVVSDREGHFTREHARAMTELGSFVGIALRMRESEYRLKAALGDQRMLAGEMNHRIKNLFAMTSGMIRAGMRTAPDIRAFAEDLQGRLKALASAHALVSRDPRDAESPAPAGEIGSLIRAVLEPHQPQPSAAGRVRTQGPKVACGSHAINAIALVFHELATNAAKYGALSEEAGFVDVRWQLAGDDLRLHWTEHGGPPLAGPPGREGFGSALVRSTVTGQLGGSLTHDWAPEGLRVTLALPLARLDPHGPTRGRETPGAP
jgi:two-component sensor histidine kinase